MTATLRRTFTRSLVMELAGPLVFGRGLDYLRDGRVAPESGGDRQLTATVRGTLPYAVELRVEGTGPAWSCTCPAADDGSFCKHCTAVALLLTAEAPEPAFEESTLPDAADDDPRALLSEYVTDLSRGELVDLVLQAAASDWQLRERLLAAARAARGEPLDLASWRRRLEVVFAPYDDLVTYQEAPGWAAEVHEVIDALEELCDAGHPDAVMRLTEYAHRQADLALGYLDDSDGYLTDISLRLAELHHRACVEGDPDPSALAERLVDLELTSELDGFHRAAATYADVLGPGGLAAYRAHVEPRWRALPPDPGGWSSERYALREAMVGVASGTGDPDALIEVHGRDLRSADACEQIARALQAAGRVDEAIGWARDGLDALADQPWQTAPLRDYLAGLLRSQSEEDDALALYREAFDRQPSLTAYRRLLEEAGEGTDSWKQRALEVLRRRLGDGRQKPNARWPPAAANVLVEILAYEGDIDEAWQVATEHGCHGRLWTSLARAREDTHPMDAIGVYEPAVFDLIEARKNDTYRQAVDLLTRIRRLSRAAGRPERFDDILTRVRAEHSRKRNLMQLLDRKGW